MTAALFIVCGFASSADAAPIGTNTTPGKEAELHVEGGMASALPTVLLGGSLGVSDRADVGVRAVTHAGLAYSLSLRGRLRLSDRFGVGLGLDESFYTLEEISGIYAIRAPFGNRVAATPELNGSWTSGAGVDLGWSAGSSVGLLTLEEEADVVRRSASLSVETLHAEVGAIWPGDRGRTVIRIRAIVPISADLHLLGYIPWVGIGRVWGLK